MRDTWCNYSTVGKKKFHDFEVQISNIGYYVWYIIRGDQKTANYVTHIALVDKCDWNTPAFDGFNFHVNKIVQLDDEQKFQYAKKLDNLEDYAVKFNNGSPVMRARGTVYIKEIDMNDQFGTLHQVLPKKRRRDITGANFYNLNF